MNKIVLHVGCGSLRIEHLPGFLQNGWEEIRVDIDPLVEPDYVSSLTNLSVIHDNSVDAVYSAHNLEHLYAHEVPVAFAEFYRVLRSNGLVFITLPDLLSVAQEAVSKGLEHVIYESSMGPITPLDVIYGHQGKIAQGNSFMAHKTGFSSDTLKNALLAAGFEQINLNKKDYALWATGVRP